MSAASETAVHAAQTPDTPPIRTDVLIVGAGPTGLFAAFEAGVLGLSCHIVDALGIAGGQCIELYPDKPIYDIPALPVCTARELVERLLRQCAPFEVPMTLGERLETLEKQDDGRFLLRTERGTRFDAAAVLLAAGNGAFVPQRLALEQAAPLEGAHIHYAVRDSARFAGEDVIIAGGGDSALDWALALLPVARRVTLVHRRDAFRAAESSVAQMREAVASGRMDLVIGTVSALHTDDTGLQAVSLATRDGTRQVNARHIIALYGLVASLGPLADWGMTGAGGRIDVDTHFYETSLPGVFAAGDLANYVNKQKLILSGFHEASLALRRIFQYARPDQKRTHIHSSYDARLAARIGDGSAPSS